MLTMGITASVLGPIAGGLMPAYFVVTALTTVRPVTAWTRWVNVSTLVVAVVLALGSMDNSFKAFASPGGMLNGVPFFMLFFIGTVMAIAAAGDVREMRSGPLRGGPPARAAPVAYVLRTVHCGRIVFFDPGARSEDPSGTIHHARNARSPNRVGVHCDVLLAVACPWPAEWLQRNNGQAWQIRKRRIQRQTN